MVPQCGVHRWLSWDTIHSDAGVTMPTILREGPFRFYFVSGDRGEPPHVHIGRGNGFAKFWLDPVELQSSGNFSRVELRRIRGIVERNQTLFLEAWYDYFSG